MTENFVAEAWSEWAIAIAVIFLRFYARGTMLGWRKLALDDIFMALAGLAYTAETTAAYYVAAKWLGLANSGITEEQRKTIDPNSQEWRFRVNGSKTHIVGWFTYVTLLWLLKGCWIVYYSRLTAGLHKVQLRIKHGYVLLAATYVAAILLIVFKCFPLHKQWQIFPDPGNNCQPAVSRLQVSFVMAINAATDLYLMAIPLPMIYKSGLPTRKKIALLILFSGGFLVIAFAILRCVSLLTVGETNPVISGEWSVRESFLAVLVSNFPMIFPLLRNWWRKAQGQSTYGSASNQSYPLEDTPQHSSSRPNKKRGVHPLFYTNDTAFGSDEAIVHVAGNAGTVSNQKSVNVTRTRSWNEEMDNMDLVNGSAVRTTVRSQNSYRDRGKYGNKDEGGQNSPTPESNMDGNHIMVVHEYSVHEDTSKGKGRAI